MHNPLILPELREMLLPGGEADLAAFLELHPATAAEFAEGLSCAEIWELLEKAPLQLRADIFSFFPPWKQVELATGGSRERMSRLLEAMPHDDRADLLKRLDDSVVESLLPLVNKADREDIRRLLSFPEDSAGAIMTTDFASLTPQLTVDGALQQLRKQAPSRETIYYSYVLDENQKLIGFVSLYDLMLASPNTKIAEIMREDVVSVPVHTGWREVASLMAKYDFLALPVVDEANQLIGIVTHDDILDVVSDEANAEMQRQAGVAPMEEDHLSLPFITVWRNRSVWLACLFVAELFTFTALAHFEEEIDKIVALSLFVPLCISTGGNSGSQAATLICRSLATGAVTPGQWLRVLWHELKMGLALGATLGAIGYVRALMTPASVLGPANRWLLAIVIGQAVALICLWGTLVGSVLPLIFKKLGFDPGYASSPFVATFVDVTGIVIYFSIAKMWLL